ncbi:MAG: amidohydrolase family protein [Clostridia bacterium]|nr:amidohydrolase family protein [Clostridia bacterium]
MHCHIYPDKIAQKATEVIGQFYDIPMYHEAGSCLHLINSLKAAGVSQALVCSAATTPAQVCSINNFIAASVEKYPETFIGFGTMHAYFENIGDEIDRMISLGLKGIKLHPDFQKFAIDSPAAMNIYEAAEGRLPILFHTGDRRYDFSGPDKLANVLRRFPGLKVIGAHFAGYSQWDEAVKYLADFDIMVDTSSSLPFLSAEKAKELARIWGIDRMMFGSDFPMWSQSDELVRAEVLGITSEEDKEKYYYLNGARLLGLA